MFPTKISTVTFVAIALTMAPPLKAQDQGSSAPSTKGTQPAPSTKQGAGMQGMGNMSGGDMQKMMAHCAEMREQMKQGKPMSSDMQSMMKQCDQMDKDMPMPNATKSR